MRRRGSMREFNERQKKKSKKLKKKSKKLLTTAGVARDTLFTRTLEHLDLIGPGQLTNEVDSTS